MSTEDSDKFLDKVILSTNKLFRTELDREDRFMTTEDITEVLKEDDDIIDEFPRKSIIGYPTRPLYRDIAGIMHIWMVTEECPVVDLPSYDLFDEQSYKDSRNVIISSVHPLLMSIKSLWGMWSEDEIVYNLREICKMLGKRGLLDLLGIRKTVGTFDLWPPPMKLLEKAFKENHSANSQLSVGARALAKHFHRDQTDSWWGVSTGSERVKSEHALKKMEDIMNSATWINIHEIVHQVKIIEVRQKDGYGVRWTHEDFIFRGFLEPQMIDGHSVGWQH